MTSKASIGILGGAGYTGGELIRLLLRHPRAEIKFVFSRSKAGQPLYSTHHDLLGVTDLLFTGEESADRFRSVDFLFLALPHGESKVFLEKFAIPGSVRVIDLSNDFRHKLPWIYGLPEQNRNAIKTANRLANPGCFATAIELALLPLALAKQLNQVTVTGITGATGAGQSLSETSHFSFRDNNIQAYKTLTHQHVPEIETVLNTASQGTGIKVSFIPWRGDFSRGIFTSSVVQSGLTLKQARSLYQETYQSHPFVSVSESPIHLKAVVNTNRAQLEIQGGDGQLVIHSVIDNLLKGASGQAVQNFNLMMGYPESEGLDLKGSAF